MVTSLVDELLSEGAIYEGAVGEAPRGRKPTLLHVRTRDRIAVAIDVRFSVTYVMLADFSGRQIALETFDTLFDPAELVVELSGASSCEGIGLVVPGMVDRRTGRVLNSPQLGWRNVDVRESLSRAVGLPVFIENAPVACALAQMWLNQHRFDDDNFVYVTISDGVGAGVVVNGDVVRGHGDTAGEFGHIPLSLGGPLCLCGLHGCWEAYTSNLATLSRYLGLDLSSPDSRTRLRDSGFTMYDLIERARSGDDEARLALEETAFYLGLGLAGIINAINPARIILGGEITGAWELIGEIVLAAAKQRTLTDEAAATAILPEDADTYPRLRGATALVVAPFFAAPQVA
jgi:predicted NBD/HSP70 family sugar kinase